ncbi:hypothetical protein [Sorangium sp. So ce131]|uniref:hypothetical protein n=1 Tax=Sorangium sp. So ce131 TaxID=3133282 RepID=UPI003F605D06
MRAALRWTALTKAAALAGAGLALAAAGACGGSVVVDGASEDPGGAGASTASSTGSRGSTSTGDGSTGDGSTGDGSTGGSGADPAAQLAACHDFCEHFDPGCPEHDCRQRCANLLAVPRPCNALARPYFECLATDIFIGPNTTCEQAARWIGPLFDCLSSSASACDTPFRFQCTSSFEAYRRCQIESDPP